MTTNIAIRQERRRLHIVTQRQANARMIVRVPYPECCASRRSNLVEFN
jgi:hypothetical protein